MISFILYGCKEYKKIVGPRKYEFMHIVKGWLSSSCCPNSECHAIGQFNNHGYYARNCMGIVDGEFHWFELTVLRGLCKSCGSTHAFLPFNVIPYRGILSTCLIVLLWIIFFDKDNAYDCDSDLAFPKPDSMSYYDSDIPRNTYTIRGIYSLYGLLKDWKKYLIDVMRRADLWKQSQPPSMKEILMVLLKADLKDFQKMTLEIHHIPLFFKRKRSVHGFPYTGIKIGR